MMMNENVLMKWFSPQEKKYTKNLIKLSDDNKKKRRNNGITKKSIFIAFITDNKRKLMNMSDNILYQQFFVMNIKMDSLII